MLREWSAFEALAKAFAEGEVRLRVAGRSTDRQKAALIGEEVETLWTNGPAGGGGARKSTQEQIGIVSCLLAREKVTPKVTVLES